MAKEGELGDVHVLALRVTKATKLLQTRLVRPAKHNGKYAFYLSPDCNMVVDAFLKLAEMPTCVRPIRTALRLLA